MQKYKKDFIDILLETDSFKFGEFELKSKRTSPYFLNIGDLNDGKSTKKVGKAYAKTIKKLNKDFDLIYGIPEKGIALAIATSIELNNLGINKPWFFTRKFTKDYGEKSVIVGRKPEKYQKIIFLDDVFTTGKAKYETLELLDNLEYVALVIAVDRQEINIEGKNAIEEFTKQTGIPVISIVNASEIYQHLKTKNLDSEKIANYLRVYGTQEAKKNLTKLEQKIVDANRSIIPSCDVSTMEEFEHLVRQTTDITKIGGYKIGFELALNYGLEKIVNLARKYTDKPLIYDHQKAGTDIPNTGKKFAKVCKKSGVDAVILFPQAGPETERAWIYHLLDQNLKVIVGGMMTHQAYIKSEGGFISDEGVLEMYRIAANIGVENFVVPGNKLDVVRTIKKVIKSEGVNPIFYAPGFTSQGGNLKEAININHAIIGRGIYEAENIKKTALEYANQI